jgi:glycosyltransferase involved in cell wall biosynthesis
MNNKENILLSILVPAYNYPEGVKRLLNKINAISKVNYEIIISDDSSNDHVKNTIESSGFLEDDRIKYIKHNSTGNAVDNWNFLIDKSRGKYIQFMHHDEFPDSKDYLVNLLDVLQDEQKELIITKCLLLKNSRKYILTTTFFKKIIAYLPYFLIFKNVYGSPSNFIYLKEKNLSFDKNLIYLVDVDFYIKAIKKCSNIFFMDKLSIVSEIENEISITSKISDSLSEIVKEETRILEVRFKDIKINQFMIIGLKQILNLIKFFILIFKFIIPSRVN